MMKLLYVADGRSPIALNWIGYFIQHRHEVHLASTYPCQAITGLASQVEIPLALGGLAGSGEGDQTGGRHWLRRLAPVRLRTLIRQWVGPISIPKAARALQELIEQLQPDLIHAMRIPYEGMLASAALKLSAQKEHATRKPPLLISVWGNDFTLHARSTSTMDSLTHQVLSFADGLHTDCQRDLRLALESGYAAEKLSFVLPGAGGIQTSLFYPKQISDNMVSTMREDIGATRVINPRGYRAYVRNDTFFKAIPFVLEKYPYVLFICPGMRGEEHATKWVRKLGIDDQVELLPHQSREKMAELFQVSHISLSITTHDGTPNSLLEAMACGCFPIAGDIESLREWIVPGENGLLVDPTDPQALAQAIMHAISHPELRQQARERNILLVKEHAEYGKVMSQAEEFYLRLVKSNQQPLTK
jgi:glycosyltransferase involved in cell wall biosynthesis